ncbi:MAG: hypothetical protein RLZZ101_1039 [Pseudomonadota bacterium]
MLAFFQNMTLGKWIVVVCATLFCIVAIVFLRDLLTKKKEEEEKPVSPEESEKVKLEPLLVGSIQKTHQLEDVINQKISNMKLDLMAERLRITSTAEVLKNLAIEKRFPETLYQIYYETRAFPKKSPEAQETDLEWHRQAGITDLSVEPIVAEDGILIRFTLQDHQYSLSAINYRFARTYFVELILRDPEDVKLLVARVKANESTGREILEKAVIEMRSGDWIDDIASCRLLMDKRKTEVQLLAEHREVETLKSRFILNQAIRKKQ